MVVALVETEGTEEMAIPLLQQLQVCFAEFSENTRGLPELFQVV